MGDSTGSIGGGDQRLFFVTEVVGKAEVIVSLWEVVAARRLLFQTNGRKGTGDECEVDKEETLRQEVEEVKPQICSDHLATTINWEVNDGTSLEEGSTELAKERTNKIMQNFAKALWNVLKQYKGKLERAHFRLLAMKRGYQESSSSGSLRPPQSKIRHNPEGDARFLEDESTKVFDRKVANHYSARMNQTLEEQGASPIIHLKKLNNCHREWKMRTFLHHFLFGFVVMSSSSLTVFPLLELGTAIVNMWSFDEDLDNGNF
ncbi:mRNA cap guanine-N7 methyltransferase 1 [Camellia lanceoleosa]|nr:mRNA cap guanine-N7 methyltransferase 1 [Camellia lanceoleosa]